MLKHIKYKNKSNKKHLYWFINFLNTDIPILSSKEFSILIQEFTSLFYDDEQTENFDWSDIEINRNALIQAQDKTINIVHRLQRKNMESIRNDQPFQFSIDIFTRNNIIIQNNHISIRPQTVLKPFPIKDNDHQLPSNVTDLDSFRQKISGSANVTPKQGLFFSHCYDPDIEKTILLTIINLMKSSSIDFISNCYNCSKYFLRPSKQHDKNICYKCNHRQKTYQWREKNRKIYNIYQAHLKKGVKKSMNKIREELRKSL